jgi:hypothetical protein
MPNERTPAPEPLPLPDPPPHVLEDEIGLKLAAPVDQGDAQDGEQRRL